jgi:predicted nucleic acid-binding protein
MRTKPKYYWDACIFLAWLQDERPPRRKPGEMEGLAEIVDEVERGDAVVVTSALTQTEVLSADFTEEQKTRFDRAFQRPSCVVVNVDQRIARLASEIRDRFRGEGKRIQTPDAVHMASALIVGADALHTFDDKLLGLDGQVLSATPVSRTLCICKPSGQQTVLVARGETPDDT